MSTLDKSKLPFETFLSLRLPEILFPPSPVYSMLASMFSFVAVSIGLLPLFPFLFVLSSFPKFLSLESELLPSVLLFVVVGIMLYPAFVPLAGSLPNTSLSSSYKAILSALTKEPFERPKKDGSLESSQTPFSFRILT